MAKKDRDSLSDQDRLILEMWEHGASGTEIGKQIGKTRSAVLGKLNRLRAKGFVGYKVSKQRIEAQKVKLKAPKKPEKAAKVEVKPPKNPIRVFKFTKDMKMRADPQFIEPTPSKAGEPVKFMRLEHWMCKYVVSGDRPADFMFCGQKAYKQSYCEQHYKLCYIPYDKRKRENLDVASG